MTERSFRGGASREQRQRLQISHALNDFGGDGTGIFSAEVPIHFAFQVDCGHICCVHPGSSSQRKLVYAVVVTLLTFAIMTAWGIFIRPYTDGFSGWLGDRLGNGLSFIAVLVIAGILLAYALWPRTGDPPPLAIRKPLWFKIIGGFFFWLPIAGLLFVGIALGLAYLT